MLSRYLIVTPIHRVLNICDEFASAIVYVYLFIYIYCKNMNTIKMHYFVVYLNISSHITVGHGFVDVCVFSRLDCILYAYIYIYISNIFHYAVNKNSRFFRAIILHVWSFCCFAFWVIFTFLSHILSYHETYFSSS